ncbi:MAG: hypothetical protein ACXADL_03150 [Candidatus Thorarchaeota archaeon]|jgi:hypothetical protein
MEVRSLYIIKRDTGACMFHKDFSEAIFDADLISSFITAMSSFFDEATHSMNSRARAFEGTDYKIIVEFGEWTLGAISVKEDSARVRTKLKRIISKFEEQFALLRWVDMDLAVYTRFERNVIEEFIRNQIHADSIIRVRLNWDLFTKNPDVVAFLRLIPEVCSVRDAAEFLEVPVEVAMNVVADALWEKTITIREPVKPDDIYQATSMVRTGDAVKEVSPETAKALPNLDGETPLSIAAEKVKTADLKHFLDEIGFLVEKHAVEKVPPAQAISVLYSETLQKLLNKSAMLLGFRIARRIFFASRGALVETYPWLSFVDLEEGVNVDIKSSLTSATAKGSIGPETLRDGFRAFMQFITKRISFFTGSKPINTILKRTKIELERQFPSRTSDIEWEQLTA